ncbi:MAG: arylsulfatase [Cyclobacteriaceae bacterium]
MKLYQYCKYKIWNQKITVLLTAFILFFACSENNDEEKEDRVPNIIFILSDDLSWGDLGCFGQDKIKTPNIDRIANEGIKFTNAYAGSTVCAPSRSSLMQGLHQGHARVRGNAYRSFRESLKEEDFTVAMLLQEAGYQTGLFGKWGLALNNQPGIPNNKGFDEFYGYLNQRQAHTFYPEFLYHNKEKVFFPGNHYHFEYENYSKASSYDEEGKCIPNGIADPAEAVYSFDIINEKALDFVKQNKDQPFFLYLANTIPHGPLIVPELGEYKDKDWPIQHKEWAAMISRMDGEVGNLLGLLEELGLDDDTIIFFASDNGNSSHGYEKRYLDVKEGPTLSEFFNHDSPTRGRKGNEYNGGFHIPAMARWPGKIPAGSESDHLWAFWDFLPTAADLAGVSPPSDIDGISILPTLTGNGEQMEHEYLYWEHNQNQAIRMGDYYAHKASGAKVELYDLIADPQQENDISEENRDMVDRIKKMMADSHRPSDVWPSPGESREAFLERMKAANIPERPDNVGHY